MGIAPKLSDSRMAMWHSLVALAYADNTLKPEERAMLEDYLKANHLSAEQYDQIEADIKNGIALKDVYPKITDIHDRSNLLNMARVLFYSDGDFSTAEQKAYDAIYCDQEKSVDFHKVEAEASKNIADFKQKMKSEEAEKRAGENRIERLLDFIDDFFGLD
jgi:hypothetical protein